MQAETSLKRSVEAEILRTIMANAQGYTAMPAPVNEGHTRGSCPTFRFVQKYNQEKNSNKFEKKRGELSVPPEFRSMVRIRPPFLSWLSVQVRILVIKDY